MLQGSSSSGSTLELDITPSCASDGKRLSLTDTWNLSEALSFAAGLLSGKQVNGVRLYERIDGYAVTWDGGDGMARRQLFIATALRSQK